MKHSQLTIDLKISLIKSGDYDEACGIIQTWIATYNNKMPDYELEQTLHDTFTFLLKDKDVLNKTVLRELCGIDWTDTWWNNNRHLIAR